MPKKEMHTKRTTKKSSSKNTPYSVLGLLFGDSLDELIGPWILNLASFLIGLKLISFMIQELSVMVDALTVLFQKFVNFVKLVYGQYQAYYGYQIVPISENSPKSDDSTKCEKKTEDLQVNSKTEVELKVKQPVKKEERVQMFYEKQ